jgi:3-deoxy-D-manno-octulosonic-acid transferase
MEFIYSLLYTITLLCAAPWYLWRYRDSRQLGAWLRERLGWLPARFQQKTTGAIWVHAVSVGETLAAASLVRELRNRFPERPIFMSHVTPTGRAAGEKSIPWVDGRFYLPFDWKFAVRRVLRLLRPQALLILETELWPNLILEAHRAGTKVLIANARLSDRSSRGYARAPFLVRRLLEGVDAILAQSERDARRFRALGAPPGRVVTAGNIKFDAAPPAISQLARDCRQALLQLERTPAVIAASTMPGEEPLLLNAWQQIIKAFPRAFLILAPRHPPRAGQVQELLEASDLKTVRRTALPSTGMEQALQGADVLILDTVGELAGLFSIADLVVMGGTFVPTGGHNLIEPSRFGVPVIFGPSMHNFRDIATLFLGAQAGVQVKDSASLARTATALLRASDQRALIGRAAEQLVRENTGATRRILAAVQSALGATGANAGEGA